MSLESSKNDLTYLALQFCIQAHKGQTRKYSDVPYCTHPIRVSQLVKSVGGTPEMIAAAYLHDVVEDVDFEIIRQTSFNLKPWNIGDHLTESFLINGYGDCFYADMNEEYAYRPVHYRRGDKLYHIKRCFGKKVKELVEMVTDVSQPEDGNRKTRKKLDLEHLAKGSPEGKTIKLADLIDNAKDICLMDPDFARVYMREKQDLLEVLQEGNKILFDKASNIVLQYYLGKKEQNKVFYF